MEDFWTLVKSGFVSMLIAIGVAWGTVKTMFKLYDERFDTMSRQDDSINLDLEKMEREMDALRQEVRGVSIEVRGVSQSVKETLHSYFINDDLTPKIMTPALCYPKHEDLRKQLEDVKNNYDIAQKEINGLLTSILKEVKK